MADAAAARREARRRRILENSNNRLQLISGKPSNECSSVSHNRYQTPEPNYEVSVPTESHSSSKYLLNNGVLVSEPDQLELLSSRQYNTVVAAGDGESANDSASFSSSATVTVQVPSPWEKLILHKYDIALLSLFIQLLYGLSIALFDSTYIFLPFAVYDITKLIYFPVQNNSKLANVLLLLNGLSGQRAGMQSILSMSQWAGAIFQDLCVYLFTMICVQSLIITLKENFVT